MYAVISIQLDNKYPEKQSVIYFTSHYRYQRILSLGGANKCFAPSEVVSHKINANIQYCNW